MIAKERPPALGWRVSSHGHVLGHAGLSDIDADLEELSMAPRRSPQRIGNAHLADKLAYLRHYSWSATTAPRLPPPVRSEPGAVPFNHGSPASRSPRRRAPSEPNDTSRRISDGPRSRTSAVSTISAATR